MRLTNETNEILLKRKTVIFESNIGNSPTPSREGVGEMIAKYLNTNKKLVVVDKIKTFFKENKIQITARIYKDFEHLKKIEDSNLLKRHKEEVKPEEKKEQVKEIPAQKSKEA